MKLVDSKTMSALDRRAIREFGLKGIVLMENAGKGCADIIRDEFLLDSQSKGSVSIFTGSGNNGGDGYVVARHLSNYGYKVKVYSLASKPLKGDALKNSQIWETMGGVVKTISNEDDFKNITIDLMHSRLIVDALLGTGISSPVKDLYEKVINKINRLKKPIVSIDVPSGLDASTGIVRGTAIRAAMTITMEVPKVGHFVYPGRDYTGTLRVVPIGMPAVIIKEAEIKWHLIDKTLAVDLLKDREDDSHKGSFGHLLTFAGSMGKGGAGKLASMAALRSGTGLSTLAVPKSIGSLMEQETTEVMTVPLEETYARTFGSGSVEGAVGLLGGKDAVVIGPGCTDNGSVGDFVIKLLRSCRERGIPALLDADGLNVVAKRMKDFRSAVGVNGKVVLTPHPGEMARLLGKTPGEVQSDRLASVEELVSLTRSTVVLKGAGTIIGIYNKKKQGRKIFINSTGNQGMATAGTGDVLSGMIGGFLAQGYNIEEGVSLAVYLHGLAGDMAAKKGPAGMVATDILNTLPMAIEKISNYKNQC